MGVIRIFLVFCFGAVGAPIGLGALKRLSVNYEENKIIELVLDFQTDAAIISFIVSAIAIVIFVNAYVELKKWMHANPNAAV